MKSEPAHVMRVLGVLMMESRELMLERSKDGLRPSSYRVIDAVPAGGVTVTELADRLGMTKQGVGQFVRRLVDSGHLMVESTSADRRVKVVRRTAPGEAAIAEMLCALDELERRWSDRVGTQRYADFRSTLTDLTSECLQG
jgi:DNA-binding MarR family transcriptional regulator